ncbi:uncharacterized protein SPPG_05587 [Spizellomyces punctatus DAOM BR117]|uniref:G-protein coupled receptors family 2 profile 2 domain-containing protein n=1 Tax=Spizellomyces punctatus (strain DAOM BR117) TaxID=645134 RepID=A0A0L0HCU9_SPIPD|nr:uncharacterized protein SPPG_05587 [Spizellomyces punctatus DAOM BR117]KNC99340.1 hypothetical protein SPPG_05587 [Spizellomyces punctatus DAOM BR117]|eukprot:XP_016607380.1 hypothetical protein SPPG_05587 [Spizellomyces punctatus DAOM BR117]
MSFNTTNSTLSADPGTDDGHHVAIVVSKIFLTTAVFSIISSAAVVYSYFSKRELQTASLHFVAVMSVCDIGFATKFFASAISTLQGDDAASYTGTPLCELSGHAGQFFALSTVLWNGVLSVNLFFLLYQPRAYKPDIWIKRYHIFVWGFCALSAAILWGAKQIGFTEDGTCWIEGKRNSYRLIFYLPLCISFLVSIVSVAYATYRLNACGSPRVLKAARSAKSGRKRNQLIRIYFITIVFITVWSWSIIFRATAFNSDSPPPLWLIYVQAFFLGSQGLFNAVAWGVSLLFARVGRNNNGQNSSSKKSKDGQPSAPGGQTQTQMQSVGSPISNQGGHLSSVEIDSDEDII